MPNRQDRDQDERNRGEFSDGHANLGGYYARDTHRGGLTDDYARDAGWSGGGGHRDYAREERVASFRGRGPKNWRRSDERIREVINERLTDDHDVDASDIDVTVENAEVTLSGKVSSRREKRLAEDIAYACGGVHDVHNRLLVDREIQVGKARE